MATKQLYDFHPFVMPYAPGALDPNVDQALRLSAVEFCQRTRAWRHEVSMAAVSGGSAIVVPDYARIHEIESAHFNKQKLDPISFDSIDPNDTATGQPRYFTQIGADTIRVLPFQAGTLDLVLFLKPFNGLSAPAPVGGYNQVPEFIYEHHAQLIADGALARILMVPNQSYTNPSLGAQFRAAFDSGCDHLFNLNSRGQQRSRTRTKSSYL